MNAPKNTQLRNRLARQIVALRAIQKVAYPRYYLSRGTVPRTLTTVRAESSLGQIMAEACAAWLTTTKSVIQPQHWMQSSYWNEGYDLEQHLAQAIAAGFKPGLVTLVPRTAPVPWEAYTEEVLDIVDDVRASDAEYATYIEGIWEEHQARLQQTEEEKQAYAQYLALKARFEK